MTLNLLKRFIKKLYIEYTKILQKTYIDPLSIIITINFFSFTKDTIYFIITYFFVVCCKCGFFFLY